MTVRALGWLGVRTPHSAAMAAFYRDVLGLEVVHEQPEATWMRTGDGTQVHVYGPGDTDHDFFGTGPVVGFVVDSFREVHAALTAAGIEFAYPEPQRAGGQAWQHFRAPDGNVYEIIGPDDLPPAA
jgi:catechol 2,3-dioxygenase-like lactoylglutathione lyase family enzyme